MRVMHVITGLSTGGAETMLLKLLSSGTGSIEHGVVSLADEGMLGAPISALGVPVYSLGLHPTVPNPLRLLSIRAITRRLQPQLIQGWMPHGNLMASLAGALSKTHTPVLWNVRMSLQGISRERMLTRGLIRFNAMLSSYPQAIVYNSQAGAKQHEAFGYRACRRVVIPNGFDCQIFRPDEDARRRVREELGLPATTILVGLIARYDPLKDHANFLRAAALVSKAHPEARFVLAGSGVTWQEPLLENLITEAQLRNQIFLLGERRDISAVTAALDIACSASWAEGFSNSIGEAMACGVPCVVTDIGDSAHLVGDTGLVVPARESQALAKAICQLIDAGPAARRQLGEAARRRVESEFSLPAVVRCYEDLYRECVVRRAPKVG